MKTNIDNISSINNIFEAKVVYRSLEDEFDLDQTKIILKQLKKNNNDTVKKMTTFFYFYKILSEKYFLYDDRLDTIKRNLLINFSNLLNNDFFETICKRKNVFSDMVSLVKKEQSFPVRLLEYKNRIDDENEQKKYLYFLSFCITNEEGRILIREFINAELEKDLQFFNFNDFNEDFKISMIEETKKQFLNTYMH